MSISAPMYPGSCAWIGPWWAGSPGSTTFDAQSARRAVSTQLYDWADFIGSMEGYARAVSVARSGFAATSDGRVAYEVRGEADVDVLYFPDWVVPLSAMDERHLGRFIDRLSSFARVLLFDRRGIGQSDPLPPGADRIFEYWLEDAVAVLDAAGAEKAVVVGGDIGGQVALGLAARHPDRVLALVVANTCARYRWADDHPIGVPDEVVAGFLGMVEELWGSGYPPLALLAPSMLGDQEFEQWSNRVQRLGASPRTARALLEASCDLDLRPILSEIHVPTLVLHSQGDQLMSVEHGRQLGRSIPGARYVELPGADHPLPLADADAILDEIEQLTAGTRGTRSVLWTDATLLMSDVVGSTGLAAEMGNARWRRLLDDHDRAVREQLARHHGRLIKSTGDGVLARFVDTADAVRCAVGLRAVCGQLGLGIRSGIHRGRIELRDAGDVAGLDVHATARIAALAERDEILISNAAAEASEPAGIRYQDRGVHKLRGVPGEWPLAAVHEASPAAAKAVP